MIILAIDPGKSKCGVAILSEDHCIYRKVYKSTSLKDKIKNLADTYNFNLVVVGNGTYSKYFINLLEKDYEVKTIDESNSTLEGRKLYFYYNPPVGLKKFILKGLLSSSVDIDDYVAEVIGKRYIDKNHTT